MIQMLAAKLNGLRARMREAGARRTIAANWASPPRQVMVDGAPMLISLTSYPARFGTLALTLRSLLRQTVRPEAVMLWIGEKDVAALPEDVLALKADGLVVRPCEDFRSYTKFVHALREFPDHRIAICDDDTFYRPGWLAALATPMPDHHIACHRIHRIRLGGDGRPVAYNDWEQASPARDESPLNYPTGVGGVMLRASQFDPRVFDMATARAICPTADDSWLYWMGRLGGSRFVRVGDNDPLISWRASQHVALWRTNNAEAQANNAQIDALIERFGADVLSDTPAAAKPQAS